MQFTTQMKIDDIHAEFLSKTAEYIGNLRVKLLNDLLDNKPVNELKSQYIANYHITARQFNSLSSEVRGVIQSAKELRKDNIMFSERISEKGVKFTIYIQNDVPALLSGDPTRLKQVIINLINNAIKFTHKGEIIFKVWLESQTSAHVRINFSVSDTGIGIPKDKLSTIFETFTQADNSITRRYGGTGLGLSICQKLVNMMDGDISVESDFEKGSVFLFTAEFEKQSKEYEQIYISKDIKDKKNRRFTTEHIHSFKNVKQYQQSVLLVDDNETNLEVACGMLTDLGHSVDMAMNGKEAIIQMQKKNYDIVFMDLQMPVMDGFEATRQIRSLEAKVIDNHIPIIAMTAHAMKEDRDRCLNSGMNGYVVKPISKKEIFLAIENILVSKGKKTVLPTQYSDEIIKEYIETKKPKKEDNAQSVLKSFLKIFNYAQFFYDAVGGNEQRYFRVMGLTFKNLPPRIKNLKKALSDKDTVKVGSIAHEIKGSAGNIKAQSLYDIAMIIEKAGKAGDINLCNNMIEKLEHEAIKFLNSLFIEILPFKINELEIAIKNKDTESIIEALHSVIDIAEIVNEEKVKNIASNISKAVNDADMNLCNIFFETLKIEIKKIQIVFANNILSIIFNELENYVKNENLNFMKDIIFIFTRLIKNQLINKEV